MCKLGTQATDPTNKAEKMEKIVNTSFPIHKPWEKDTDISKIGVILHFSEEELMQTANSFQMLVKYMLTRQKFL